MTDEAINKMASSRHLLPEPAPEVVGDLIEQVRRLRQLVLAVKATNFDGMLCGDVNGKNWFDERSACFS